VTVGVIGIGLLGTALASRIAGAGFRLCGFDPDPAAGERLAALGGDVMSAPEQVARATRRMIWSLPGPVQVREIVVAVKAAVQPGTIILDTTTGDPDDVCRHAAEFADRGVSYLDCEVGGSSRQTAAGEAIVICGGDADAFAASRDILNAIGSPVFHTGPAGTGTRMKLALNIAIGLHRAVLAEALSFAEKNGIEPSRALEILKSGPAYSRAMDVKGARMLSGDYTPEARLAQHLKDVRLILQTGRKTGARLPLSELHEALLDEAVERGLGSSDNSAVIELYRKPWSS
jgi:3-hydroxyisobutyrate dehydrogenase-like beta-hydroxyacid dehydrogenase